MIDAKLAEQHLIAICLPCRQAIIQEHAGALSTVNRCEDYPRTFNVEEAKLRLGSHCRVQQSSFKDFSIDDVTRLTLDLSIATDRPPYAAHRQRSDRGRYRAMRDDNGAPATFSMAPLPL